MIKMLKIKNILYKILKKNIKIFFAFLIIGINLFSVGCEGNNMEYFKNYLGSTAYIQKNIYQVNKMPDMPTNYEYFDYGEIAKGLDSLLYEFAKNPNYQVCDYKSINPTYLPIGYWINNINNHYYSGKGFGIPSYVGHVNSSSSGTIFVPEGITVLASVYGASLNGINKQSQKFIGENGEEYEYNFVNMLKEFYNNEGFVLNRMNTSSGASFWYDIYPQILYARINNLYRGDIDADEIVLKGADNWIDALPYFYDNGNGKFAWTGFDFSTMTPIISRWVEPPNSGIAFLLINAFKMTGKEKYFEAAVEYLDYVEAEMKNTTYEILTDYLCYTAAYMNFTYGTNYNIAKFVNNIFDSEDDYRPSGIVNGKWGDYDAYGLSAFDNWGHNDDSAYAFAMNTYSMAGTLAPMLRYDTRFADGVGKWFLHATNSARLFYGSELPSKNQSCIDIASYDKVSCYISYEGVRKQYNSRSPYAMGDPRVYGWGQTDFGIYGGSHVGIFGGLVAETNVEQILQIDITKANDFGERNDFKQYLYYNPYNEKKEINVNIGNEDYILFDTISQTIVSKNVTGNTKITIPEQSSMIIAIIPSDAVISEDEIYFKVNGINLTKKNICAVNIESITEPKTVVSKCDITEIFLSYECQKSDEILNLKIVFNGKNLYDGKPISKFLFDPLKVTNNWLYVPGSYQEGGRNWNITPVRFNNQFYEGELKFEITTTKGFKDVSVSRIRQES